jgi:lipopolysaccharide/colanic/teichoic acid biosynthesis glycosyltransferase
LLVAADVHSPDIRPSEGAACRALHRSLDLVGATALLALASPLLVAAALAIRVGMGRPVLFRHTRAGRDGIPFDLVKLRTMRPLREGETAPDADGIRITPLGRVLRSTSIDELPSLFNVLRGDMALVGPRPLPVRYVDRYTARQRCRLAVRPGLTGWAQINGRNALPWADRLELDAWYVDHRSVALDLRILAGTIPVILRRAGISHADHATMAELPKPT